MSDINEREFWNEYMSVYEKCLEKTSTEVAPWHIVPADSKENAHIIVSQIIVDAMESLHLRYPKFSSNHSKELKEIRKMLSSD